MGSRLEPLFHALELELLIPAAGVGAPPSRESELRDWWDDVRAREKRDTAFLGEFLPPGLASSDPPCSCTLILSTVVYPPPQADEASWWRERGHRVISARGTGRGG